jgi:hypothetical protein
MAGQRKRIVAVCYGPIAFGPQYRSPWEDVWIRWKAKPGRRLYYAAPTLICRAELLADLKRTRERHRKRPRLADITHDEAMLAALEVSPHAADGCDPPNVYTRANGINRAEAERMLAFWLERRHGIKNPKFGWRKTDFWITPTGFGEYQSPDSTESGAHDVAPRQMVKI